MACSIASPGPTPARMSRSNHTSWHLHLQGHTFTVHAEEKQTCWWTNRLLAASSMRCTCRALPAATSQPGSPNRLSPKNARWSTPRRHLRPKSPSRSPGVYLWLLDLRKGTQKPEYTERLRHPQVSSLRHLLLTPIPCHSYSLLPTPATHPWLA